MWDEINPANESAWLEEFGRLERVIAEGREGRLRARWESGRGMLLLRGDQKRLPNRKLKKLSRVFAVHRSELTARMKFAEKFRTEAELTTVVVSGKSWYEIRQRMLTDKPKGKKPNKSTSATERIRCARKDLLRFACVNPPGLTEEDLQALRQTLDIIKNMAIPGELISCALGDIERLAKRQLTEENFNVIRRINYLTGEMLKDAPDDDAEDAGEDAVREWRLRTELVNLPVEPF